MNCSRRSSSDRWRGRLPTCMKTLGNEVAKISQTWCPELENEVQTSSAQMERPQRGLAIGLVLPTSFTAQRKGVGPCENSLCSRHLLILLIILLLWSTIISWCPRERCSQHRSLTRPPEQPQRQISFHFQLDFNWKSVKVWPELSQTNFLLVSITF